MDDRVTGIFQFSKFQIFKSVNILILWYLNFEFLNGGKVCRISYGKIFRRIFEKYFSKTIYHFYLSNCHCSSEQNSWIAEKLIFSLILDQMYPFIKIKRNVHFLLVSTLRTRTTSRQVKVSHAYSNF